MNRLLFSVEKTVNLDLIPQISTTSPFALPVNVNCFIFTLKDESAISCLVFVLKLFEHVKSPYLLFEVFPFPILGKLVSFFM